MRDFRQELKNEYAKYQGACHQINLAWARENSPFSLGDIIEDHMGVGRITAQAGYSSDIGSDVPYMYFQVNILTKKFEPTKNKEKTRKIYAKNIIRKHG